MHVAWLKDLRLADLPQVGGKNASLGEMIGALSAAGIRVPGGFATTADAFREFLAQGGLDKRIEQRLRALDPKDVRALAACGAEIRSWILKNPFPAALESEIKSYFQKLETETSGETSFAVRSSATAEDLPDASFAGQQESFLNIKGADNVIEAMRHVFASLYNDRAISYRVHQGFKHADVALSAAVQQMVRSDLGASGVLFTLDTESGFRDVVFITSAYGLGEMVVQGAVNPDEFYVHKPMLERGKPAIVRRSLGSKLQKMVFGKTASAGKSTLTVDVAEAERAKFSLSDADVLELSRYAVAIEKHYGRPMDVEWGRDGNDGRIYVLQARPETVKSKKREVEERYALKGSSRVLVSGRAIGNKIGSGNVRIVPDASQMSKVKEGDILVTDMTDPNWEPVMKVAAAIVTNRGGRTCHAAIIARELGIPAVVGSGDATRKLKDGQPVTVSCADGDTGNVYDGPDPVRGLEPRARRDAGDRREDRHERRQPRARLRVCASCRTPASAWRGWNSSSTASACIPRPAWSTTSFRRT
jgi:pyruvate,water dikinase